MGADEVELDKMRKRIDAMDKAFVSQLLARLKLARRVKRAKSGDGPAAPVATERAAAIDFAREEKVVRNALKNADRQLAPHVERIMRELIGASLACQRVLSIAYLGPEGTFSHQAARSRFGGGAALLPQRTIESCFHAVERGKADCAIVPYENSTEGGVSNTLGALLSTPLEICAETMLRIRHNLLGAGQPASRLAGLAEIHAHPQSFAQCRHWLDANLPNAKQIECASNSAAAEAAAVAGARAAAIGPEGAAEGRDLNIIVADIEDNPRNTTRFIVIGGNRPRPTGDDKTSAWFAVKHEPGSLYALLKIIANEGGNMTKLESRPRPGGAIGQYVFFTDINGHRALQPLAGVLKKLSEAALELRVLGSYPRATDHAKQR